MNVAFIPVRGGSKSIPLKNIKKINGMPLVYWTAKAASESKYINKVYVSTDSQIIRETVLNFKLSKVEVIDRSEESATDTATTEQAMLEFAQKFSFDNIILIQATSPLLTAKDIDGGFDLFFTEGTDSVLSVVRQKRFNWSLDCKGFAHPINYDFFNRPRRQDFEGYLTENGAFYITSKERLIKYKSRISGNIKAYEMHEDSFFEIDEPSDWIIVENLMKKHNKHNILNTNVLKNIKVMLTDCDGVLTDGGMYYSENGDELKKFNTRDGVGFKLLKEKGIITGIITGENVELVKRRAIKLKIDELHVGVKDKTVILDEICKKYNVDYINVAYIGDDINDFEIIKKVGFGCCVNNAMECVKEVADYITKLNGGEGAVREVAEIILKHL